MSEHPRSQPHDNQPVIRLRHEAGLTAGRAMPLAPGNFQFGPLRSRSTGLSDGEPEAVSFELTVDGPAAIFARAGTEPLAVEGQLVRDPVVVRPGDVIQLATDHFTVERVDEDEDLTSPPAPAIRVPKVAASESPSYRWLLRLLVAATLAGIALGLIVGTEFFALAAIAAAGMVLTVAARKQTARRLERNRTAALFNAKKNFTADLRSARARAARDLRHAFPNPAGVTDLVSGKHPAKLGFRGRIAIAAGDLGWSPPIEDRDDAGWDPAEIVAQHDFLPAVPFTVDLEHDTIGIVGPRRAILATARHIVTATWALTDRNDLDLAVRSHADRSSDWVWYTDARPSTKAGANALTINVFDGVSPSASLPGTVMLAGSVDELEMHCDTILIISDDGTAAAEMGAQGAATGLVPLGITESHAASLMQTFASFRPAERSDLDTTVSMPLVSAPPVLLNEPLTDSASGTATAPETTSVVDTPTDEPTIEHPQTMSEQDDGLIDLRFVPEPPASPVPSPPRVIDLTLVPSSYAFLSARLMIVGAPSEEVTALVASAALEQAALHPDRPIFVLDRGDRSLIRLAQMPACRRYAAIDEIRTATEMIQQLETFHGRRDDEPALFVVADIGSTLNFYRRVGESGLAERLEAVLHRSSPVRAAASTSPDTQDLAPLADRFLVWVHPPTGDRDDSAGLRMTDSDGEHRLDESGIAGRDLTGSVAALKFERSLPGVQHESTTDMGRKVRTN